MENKKELVKKLGFLPKENTCGIYEKIYATDNYSIKIDFSKKIINYGKLICCENGTTQNFSKEENWVVLECVDRLLEKGYKPQNIILEKTWASGHGTSGRLDICVARDDGSEYLLIECKTFGKEFEKAINRLNKDGGQLFTYFKFSNKADVIMLYTSKFDKNEIIYQNEIIKIEDDYRSGDVKDFYEKWNKLTKDNGIFETWVTPYCFESKALIKNQLKPINQEDSSFIFNRFLEILRHNVVSDKGNAFNKIFTLFLCKVYDETSKQDDEELDFQWKEGIDDDISFQLRLTDLYKNGMEVFLSRTVSDFDEQEFENKYKHLDDNTKNELLREINKLRLEKNNEFAIKEVYDNKSFVENAKIVKEVVELLQNYRIRYNKRQQYLSDFFELLLTTGLKQEAGQFFTPVPIAQFIIKSLPLEKIVSEKLKSKDGELLPYMIDYAAGSGHFITEYMHEVQNIINKKDFTKYIDKTSKKIKTWQNDQYDWATDYVYGIEKDYRLVKVGKVGCYLHGDGLANVILSDGLGNFENTKDYKGKLYKGNDNLKDNQQFDIILSNPPYSVSSFRQTTRNYYTEKDFDLYTKLTDNSSEIECLFVERTKQLLKDGGIAGIILPSSILTNTGIYTKTRELLLKYFEIIAITELGSNTFMATGTNTVVLFLRRRNNYECINLEKAIDKFVVNYNDVTINGIENPIAKYVNYVWENLSYEDYITLLKQEPNDKVKKHNLYEEYLQKITSKSEKEFWNKVIELEKEKIYYFILAYPQKLVIVKTGEKEAEKQFLGYEFSSRRGSEGIHAIQKYKTIDECTKLFDSEIFDNPKKASTYIYKAFEGDLDFEIDETLKDNISKVNLIDMMSFDRLDFEKIIDTKVKKKIKIIGKWAFQTIKQIAKIEYGTRIVKKNSTGDKYPVYGGGGETFRTDSYNRSSCFIISRFGMSLNCVRFVKDRFFLNDSGLTIKTLDNQTVLQNYLDQYLYLNQSIVYKCGRGVAQKNMDIEMFNALQIPLPPIEIQQKIVNEIKLIDENSNKNVSIIETKKESIKNIFNNLHAKQMTIASVAEDIFAGGDLPKDNFSKVKTEVYNVPIYGNGSKDNGLYGYTNVARVTTPCITISARGTIGYTVIRELSFYPIVRLISVIPNKNKIILKYLKYAVENSTLKNTGAIIPQLTVPELKKIAIPVPSLETQQKIASQIEELENQIEEAQAIIDNSKQEKQKILDKYLN